MTAVAFWGNRPVARREHDQVSDSMAFEEGSLTA